MRISMRPRMLDGLRRFASVEWPVFWRARYDNALLILLGMTVVLFVAPWIHRANAMAESLGAGKGLIKIIIVSVVFLWLGTLGVFWMLRQTELSVPVHSLRAFAAPNLFVVTMFIFAWCVLAFAAALHMDDRPLDLFNKLAVAKFFGTEDSVGWWVTLIVAALVACFFKERALFGFSTTSLSLIAAAALWSLSFYAMYLNAELERTVKFEKLSYSYLLFIVFTIAPVLVLLGLPFFSIVWQMRARARSRWSHLMAATAAWNAPLFVCACLAFCFAIAALLLKLSGFDLIAISAPQTGVSRSIVGFSAGVTSQILAGVLVVSCLGIVELTLRFGARLLTLPEK